MSWLDALKRLGSLAVVVALFAFVVFSIESMKSEARQQGYKQAAAEGSAALSALEKRHAELDVERARAAEDSAKAAAKKLHEEQARNDQLAVDLAEQQRHNRQTTDRLTGEIARVNDLYMEALDAPPKPLPVCVFTRGWVRIYDEATGARLPETADPGGAAAQAAATTTLEQLNSGISQSDVLAHHVRYAEQCRNNADQLEALINAVGGE